MPLLYLDTNVIMDFLLDRHPASTRLIEDAIACHHRIAISEMTFNELCRNDLEMETSNLVRWLTSLHKIDIHRFSAKERAVARTIGKTAVTHYADALHQIAARAQHADILVTSNLKDFRNCPDIDVRRPDDI